MKLWVLIVSFFNEFCDRASAIQQTKSSFVSYRRPIFRTVNVLLLMSRRFKAVEHSSPFKLLPLTSSVVMRDEQRLLKSSVQPFSIYASRRSRTRDTVKLTVCVCVCVCVCSSCNCSTVAMRRKLTASIGF